MRLPSKPLRRLGSWSLSVSFVYFCISLFFCFFAPASLPVLPLCFAQGTTHRHLSLSLSLSLLVVPFASPVKQRSSACPCLRHSASRLASYASSKTPGSQQNFSVRPNRKQNAFISASSRACDTDVASMAVRTCVFLVAPPTRPDQA